MKNVRKVLEQHVIGCNKPLAPVVESMDVLILLRNAHPLERANFASHLIEAGLMTNIEAKEFNQPVTNRI